jgi:hypothetical protein
MSFLFGIAGKLGIVGLILGLSGGAYAFTASNTVPTGHAGDGTGLISGYTISSIHYTLNSTNPTNVDTVTFTLDNATASGGSVHVKAGGSWYSCTATGTPATSVSCTTTGMSVGTALSSLEVVAAD